VGVLHHEIRRRQCDALHLLQEGLNRAVAGQREHATKIGAKAGKEE